MRLPFEDKRSSVDKGSTKATSASWTGRERQICAPRPNPVRRAPLNCRRLGYASRPLQAGLGAHPLCFCAWLGCFAGRQHGLRGGASWIRRKRVMVGTGRFELPTPRTPSECSTRLSHVPTQWSRLGRAGFRGLNQFTPATHVAPLVHHPEAYVQTGH